MGLDPKRTAVMCEQVARMLEATGPARELLAQPELSDLYLGGRPATA